MIPVHCRVKHDAEAGSYGDCLRASVASLLEIEPPENVPHFFHDGCDGETGHERLREWLATQNLVPFTVGFDGSASLDDVLGMMKNINPDVYYMLFGATKEGDHVVICRNEKIVWNSAWYGTPIIGPGSNDVWSVMVFVPSVLTKCHK